MKCMIVLFAAVAVAHAQLFYSAPLAPLAYGAPLAPSPLRTQYHAQDELGQYSFGYSGGPSSKVESSAGGVTQGAFSYVDAHGLVQSRNYVADPVNGFRVAGTDIPVDSNTPIVAAAPAHPLAILARKRRQVYFAAPTPLAYAAYPSHLPADTPEVHAAKIAHYNQYNYESLRNAHLSGRKKRSAYAYSAPIAPVALAAPSFYHAAPTVYNAVAPTVYHAAAPTVYHAATPTVYHAAAPTVYHAATPTVYHAATPVVSPVAVPAVSSQYHSQDELGQYSYGYSNPTSSKTETRHANGVTQGAYSYVDAHGLVQSANYVSDPHNGFRVAATNLPVA